MREIVDEMHLGYYYDYRGKDQRSILPLKPDAA